MLSAQAVLSTRDMISTVHNLAFQADFPMQTHPATALYTSVFSLP
jgi:hypothetical protein